MSQLEDQTYFRVVKIEEIDPRNRLQVCRKKHPLMRPVYLVYPCNGKHEAIQKLVGFMAAEEGKKAIEKLGFLAFDSLN